MVAYGSTKSDSTSSIPDWKVECDMERGQQSDLILVYYRIKLYIVETVANYRVGGLFCVISCIST